MLRYSVGVRFQTSPKSDIGHLLTQFDNSRRQVTMAYPELLTVALDFATAILLGALVGIEREKRKSEEEETHHIAGLRTFILLALFGAAAGFISHSLSAPWIFVVSLLTVGAYVVAGYYVTSRTSQNGKGLTTEVAAVIVFLLGAMVMFGYEPLAIGLGVVTAAVLAYKQAAVARVCGEAWLGRCLCGREAADRDLHRAAAAAERARRPLGRAQPLQTVAAGDFDFEPVTGRLCADAAARAKPGGRADRIGRRPRLVHGGHLVVREGRS
jgi:MgtC family